MMMDRCDQICSLIVRHSEHLHRLKLIILTLKHNINSLKINSDISNPIFIMKIRSNSPNKKKGLTQICYKRENKWN